MLRSSDWSLLLALAEDHGVTGLLSSRIRSMEGVRVPLEIQQKLRDQHRAQLFFTLSLTAELFRLLERFEKEGLETLVIKGPVLSARAYGDLGLRQYADIDLAVRHCDIQRTARLMIAAGYEPAIPLAAIAADKIPGEYLFSRPGTNLMVDVHTERTFRYYPKPLSIEGLFKRKTRVPLDGHDVPALSAEDELVLICIHGSKHLWERLMWIADVAGMGSRQSSMDWPRAFEAAHEVGAERMLCAGLGLAAGLLKASLPEEVTAKIKADAAAGGLVKKVGNWLSGAGCARPGLFERAIFRMRTRGGLIAGPAYLLRLSLSPTEEDWVKGDHEKRYWLLDAMQRPFRLARKYGRESKS